MEEEYLNCQISSLGFIESVNVAEKCAIGENA